MVWNLTRGLALIGIAFAIGASNASAAPIVIGFDNGTDPVNSNVSNGFMSADSALVAFSSPVNHRMILAKNPLTGNTNAMAVGDVIPGEDLLLEITILLPATSISMDLFNTAGAQIGDAAVLSLYTGGGATFVDSVSVPLTSINPSDPIMYTGAEFDFATLQYVGSQPRVEVVDNLEIETSPIPEPTAAVVFGAGALIFGAASRRRSRR